MRARGAAVDHGSGKARVRDHEEILEAECRRDNIGLIDRDEAELPAFGRRLLYSS